MLRMLGRVGLGKVQDRVGGVSPHRSTLKLRAALLVGGFAALGYGVFATPSQAQRPAPSKDVAAAFETNIRPVLEANCVACHGAKQHLGGVRLDQAISTDVAQRLADAITYVGDVKMPPSGKLPAESIAALSAWVKAGAPWPAAAKAAPTKRKFWSFIPPKTPPLPSVKAKSWAANPIDRFILAKLEEKGLRPSPVADRRTLIRRATFDLTGLPQPLRRLTRS